MSILNFSTFITQGIVWVIVTAIVGFCLNRLLSKDALAPWVWWCGLVITFFVLMPELPFLSNDIQSVYWINSEYVLTKDGGKFTDIVNVNIPKLPDLIGEMLLLSMVSVSFWRLGRLYRDYAQVKRVTISGIPYQSERCRYPVYLTTIKSSAFVIGLFKPVVALPDYFLSLTQKQQDMVLEHEHMHIQQKDHIAAVLWRVLCELCWFNPFLRLLEAGYNQSVEIRCDERTVKRQQYSRSDYAQTLLICLKLGANQHDRALSVGFSALRLSFEDYKKRLRLIICKPSSKRHLTVSLLLLTLTTFVMGFNAAFAGLWQQEMSWISPVNQPNVSSVFGNLDPIRSNKPHQGVDLMGAIGVIVIQHPSDWQSLYAHLSEFRVKPGHFVEQGDLIGFIGQSGRVTGPHLHFELVHQNTPVDPMMYFRAERQ